MTRVTDRQNKLVAAWLQLHSSPVQLSEIDGALKRYRAEKSPVAKELEEERASLFMAIRARNNPWVTTSLRYMNRLIGGINRLEYAQPYAEKGFKFSDKKRGASVLYKNVDEILLKEGSNISAKKMLIALGKRNIIDPKCIAEVSKRQGPLKWQDENKIWHKTTFKAFQNTLSLRKKKFREPGQK